MKIIGQIFEEDNYDTFRRLTDNRDVLSARLNKIVASISQRYVLNPIIVNEKMEIIDGQGRFEALKSLNMPIHYIISPGATSDDCRRMNKYNTKWTYLDFAKSYAKAGKQSYALLLLTCEKTKFAITRILRLVNHGGRTKPKDEQMTIYERGGLVFTEHDMENVQNIKVMAEQIKDALQFTIRPNDAFYTGVKIVVETKGYTHERMLKNCKACRATYSQMSNLSDQLVEFERIYNYRTQPKNRLFFSDYMRMRGRNMRDYDKSYSPYNDKDISTLKEVSKTSKKST